VHRVTNLVVYSPVWRLFVTGSETTAGLLQVFSGDKFSMRCYALQAYGSLKAPTYGIDAVTRRCAIVSNSLIILELSAYALGKRGR
jgi:hypothetical protein